MNEEAVSFIARVILRFDDEELARLRSLLEEGDGGAGVAAVIPPNLPLKEGGAEAPLEEWPSEYFEAME